MRRPVALGVRRWRRSSAAARRGGRCRTASAKIGPGRRPAAVAAGRRGGRRSGTGIGMMGAAEAGKMLGTSGHVALRFLVAIADIRIIDAWADPPADS